MVANADAFSLSIDLPGTEGHAPVSALAVEPASARGALVLAHGAGAGMRHAFMAALAEGLAERGIATLRYQFPFMERGSKRTDAPAVAHATVRAAVAEAARRWPALPLFAGGKSYGARMTSQEQALRPLPGVRGLVFVGFPLHPAGQPATQRAEHLALVQVPMLFLQGTRDDLAEPQLLRGVLARLDARAAVQWFEAADHAFHVRAADVKLGAPGDAGVLTALLNRVAEWTSALAAPAAA